MPVSSHNTDAPDATGKIWGGGGANYMYLKYTIYGFIIMHNKLHEWIESFQPYIVCSREVNMLQYSKKKELKLQHKK